MKGELIEARHMFSFGTVAMENLKFCEDSLESISSGAGEVSYGNYKSSCVYATMIFNLFVYLESIMNNGFREYLASAKGNMELVRLLKEKTNRNISPLVITRYLDAAWGTKYYEGSNRFKETLKFHEEIRNWVAHGLMTSSEKLIEFTDDGYSYYEEIDGDLKKLIDYFKKNKIYVKEGQESDGYITVLANKLVFDHFKKALANFVENLILSPNGKHDIVRILFGFDFEYFGLDKKYASSEYLNSLK